ncbi:adenosine deaminase [Salinibacterium hongtaonis]|uniref:Adenosine deaminase n=1 Tax=Homoserinimonas hongtaonis TaxID=2079791 RepID=A0A2U1T371_9MICO|nr:adenosine deaminase [Salinibacterium hongtaonis]AWB88508.1 adenosine deaminase [Salinibacterium hongtaonis]PWB98290.1 adenosine deaminase [Salinibacterium hongtaonis]
MGARVRPIRSSETRDGHTVTTTPTAPAQAHVTPGAKRVDEETIRSIPKAEVHVHLEGTFELIDLIELARESGVPLPGPAATLFDLGTHFAPDTTDTIDAGSGVGTGGLSAFLRFLDWQCGLIRTPQQASALAYRFAARQSASGIRYTDVIVNPTHWSAWRGRVGDLLSALAEGFDEAERDGLCVINIAYSLLRTQSQDEATTIARWLVETRPSRVIALSVDGDERVAGRTAEKFAPAFDIARDGGLRRTIHAGESSGAEGVWDAIRHLHAERIDHGVRAIDDDELVAHLAETGIPLDVCLRSNLTLGVYPDLASHPLAELMRRGVTVTVNTDDPAPIGTRLENEWSLAADAYGWGLPQLIALAHASVTASFAPDALAAELHEAIDARALALGV